MASSVFVNMLLPPMLLLAVLYCFKFGKGETGIAGTGIGYLPEPGGGNAGGGGHDEPDEVIVKALQCFSEKNIYSSCDESSRLTESGQIHVPSDKTDEYCNGPCLQETHLVLNCIDDILSHFVFYNHATVTDVKETIKEGCTYGPHRGNFNVAEHIEGDGSNSYKPSYPVILLGLSSFVLVINMLY